MKTSYNKSRIMKSAWSIKRRNSSVSFGECLSIAWSRAKCDVMEARRTEKETGRKYRDAQRGSIMFDMNMLADTLTAYYANNAYNGD